jgi:hypothetical protein
MTLAPDKTACYSDPYLSGSFTMPLRAQQAILDRLLGEQPAGRRYRPAARFPTPI